jgi:hypothetical protein
LTRSPASVRRWQQLVCPPTEAAFNPVPGSKLEPWREGGDGLFGLRGRLLSLAELAADRLKAAESARAEVERQFQNLKAQIASGASNDEVAAASAKVGLAITQLSRRIMRSRQL